MHVTEKMKDHKYAELVNTLRTIAVAFHDHGQLRERIAAEIRPLFCAAQPRKAVKLTHHQITECHPVLYGLDDDTLAFARAIEAAVLKANGWTE